MNRKLKSTKKFIYIFTLIFIVLFSVGYSALSQVLNIGGSTRYNKKYPVRVIDISLQGTSNEGLEQFNPDYTYNTTTTGVNLPNINSTVTYTVTVKNYGSEDKWISLNTTSNSNPNMTYELSNMPTNNMVPANSIVSFNVTIKYNTDTLPSDTTDTMTITYLFGKNGAMFDTGQVVNTKMKQFVDSSATYETEDRTITKIARYTDTPDPTYLTDTYKISVDEYITPIYMWYDSINTTIYWYTTTSDIYYNPDSSFFYSSLIYIQEINNINDISSTYVTNMSHMFYNLSTCDIDADNECYNETSFTLNLGDKFDTSNVTNMQNMFFSVGNSSSVFTLDLGDNFDTSSVTNMEGMFSFVKEEGLENSYVDFTLDLGDKFDTSNVTDMSDMFSGFCTSCNNITLNFGDKFDTSSVTDMSWMFNFMGAYCNNFSLLDLGDLFDTSNVTDMSHMFEYTGYISTSFTIDLGDKFDTRNVTDMLYMFYRTGYSSTDFTLDLGDKFDTSKVTDMSYMFCGTGENSTVFTLDLGDKFDTSNVTNMLQMFFNTGYKSTVFTLDLGDKFDTSNVTDMSFMFDGAGRSSTVFTLDLGDKFDTSNVTDMYSMFSSIGYSNQAFTSLDLGDKFDTSKVKDMRNLFYNCRYLKTIYAPSTFVTTAVTNSDKMFDGCTNLVGGAGTVYNSSNPKDKTYAHIDGGTANPGYFTARTTAVFKTGQEVNARMKQFVNSSATYNTEDGTITNIARYTELPDSKYLTSNNIVSTSDSDTPIYMWYDSDKTTIYWYSEANNIYYNSDSSYFYSNLYNIQSIDNLNDIKSNHTVNMSYMFRDLAYCDPDGPNCMYSSNFTLDLGNNFDTSNVTNMKGMFINTGTSSSKFSLNLGPKFNTSKVTDMSDMFAYIGSVMDYDVDSFDLTIDLGDKFDTSNVTNMSGMFKGICMFSKCGTLSVDLGDKFDTSNVTDMSNMFDHTGHSSTVFTLDLGDKFDTSNVKDMESMFDRSAFKKLDLGDKFDTSKVTNMKAMFYGTKIHEIDLGDKFDTSKVTDMSDMFSETDFSTIYITKSFNIGNDTNTDGMFDYSNLIVGGKGTIYDNSHIDGNYAVIDEGKEKPGYFSSKEPFNGAMFKSGPVFNDRIVSLTGSSDIEKFTRYTEKPDSKYLVTENIISTVNSLYPIYMWYDDNAKVIYWYTETNNVYYPTNSAYFYSGLKNVDLLVDFTNIKTTYVSSMAHMFSDSDISSNQCNFELGNLLDTSKVKNMAYMFSNMGMKRTCFNLMLDGKFNTTNVENMSGMFSHTGSETTNLSIDLGSNFYTSNVKTMNSMFSSTGKNANFVLNLKDNFDTKNVTDMSNMFNGVGGSNFTLDLGDKFNTVNTTNMYSMFYGFKGKTIYAPTTFVTTSVKKSIYMFYECQNLVGGAGTVYSSSNPIDKTYAHIDGGTSNPGYFTARP